MNNKVLHVKRVIYGKDNTPIDDQEFCITHGGPVGTIKEFKVWAFDHGYSKVVFQQKNGETFEQCLFEDQINELREGGEC